MKKIAASLFVVLSFNVKAQVFDALGEFQRDLPQSTSTTSNAYQSTPTSVTTTNIDTNTCTNPDQKSLPLKYLSQLFLQKDGQLDIVFDPRTKKLSIKNPLMIANCNHLLDFQFQKIKNDNKTIYTIKAGFKVDKNLLYPSKTLDGFEKCLIDSGVIKEGRVVQEKIKKEPLEIIVDKDIDESGDFYFLSEGPKGVDFKYEPYKRDKCNYYEVADPKFKKILTLEDAEKENVQIQAKEIEKCKDYKIISDFMEKHSEFATLMEEFRDKLIETEAERVAKKIKGGEALNSKDLSVIADFDKYLIEPLAESASKHYEEMLLLEGTQKIKKQEELKKDLDQLALYGKSPYFNSGDVQKLVKDGKFDEAQSLKTAFLRVDNFKILGSKRNNVVMTPDRAVSNIVQGQANFESVLEKEKEIYEYKTGQSSGKADYYYDLMARMNKNIEYRTQNYREEMMEEVKRIQPPNGHCFKYWINTQKCTQETTETIQALEEEMKYYNQVDLERANEFEKLAKEYEAYEKEGRRYIAKENGEEYKEEPVKDKTPSNPVAPTRRTRQEDSYTFDFQQPPQQQAMLTPGQQQNPMFPQNNMFMQQANPYPVHQSSFLGQQAFNGYGPYAYYGGQMAGQFQYNSGMPQGYGPQAFGQQPMNSPWGMMNPAMMYPGASW